MKKPSPKKSGRTVATAKLAAQAGWSFLRHKVSSEPSVPVDQADAVASAAKLVDQLGNLKGLLMKFGQMASYLPGALGPEAQGVLGQLQAHSSAVPFEELVPIIEAELGAPLKELFDFIDPVPLAAASIGQVHRAKWRGRDVVVKVQYPGIQEVLEKDLANVSMVARLGTFGLPLDAKALAEELRERSLEECDYRKEAKNQTLFRSLLKDLPGAYVPEVVPERSARRVLTSEFVRAMDFQQFCKTATQAAKNRAGQIIFTACFESIFHRCIYNGDPHPGNYLFNDDGAVTFLDFGCVRRFDPVMIETWKREARTILSGDRAGFEKEFIALGFVPNPKRFDWDHQWAALRHLYLPFLGGSFQFTQKFTREMNDHLLFRNPNLMRTAMPREWLMLNRLQWGLFAILAQLQATGRWSELYRAALESSTQPVSDHRPLHDGEERDRISVATGGGNR